MRLLKYISLILSSITFYQVITASSANIKKTPQRSVYGKVPGPLMPALGPIFLKQPPLITRKWRLERILQKYDEKCCDGLATIEAIRRLGSPHTPHENHLIEHIQEEHEKYIAYQNEQYKLWRRQMEELQRIQEIREEEENARRRQEINARMRIEQRRQNPDPCSIQ